MQIIMLVVIVGLIGGIAVGLQAPLASFIGQRIGPMESVFIVHLGGAVAAAIPLLAMRGGNLGAWRSLPWYALIAGAFGLIVIGAITYTIPRIGAATAFILIVVGQLLIGTVLDHYGLLGVPVRSMDFSRLIGIAVLLLGTWLVVR